MEFLKRHYEKLILLVLSIISILTVTHIFSIMDKTREVKDSDLKIPTRQADYQIHDAKSDDFVTSKIISSSALNWQPSGNRHKAAPASAASAEAAQEGGSEKQQVADPGVFDNYSDLVKIFRMARCPHCQKLVPLSYFSDSKCPICGKELKKPVSTGKRRIRMITDEDSDGDGIKDVDEQRYGWNPNDPADALMDSNGNGFSNIYEIENGFNPQMPNDCPPLWYRLRFRGVDRFELPLKLTNVDTAEQSDPKKWEALIKTQVRNAKGKLVWRDSSYQIGDTLKFENRMYNVVDISRKSGEQLKELVGAVPAGQEKAANEVYTVTLRESEDSLKEGAKPEELLLVLGQPVYSPDRRVILEDIGYPPDENGRRPVYGLRDGDQFTITGTSDVPIAKLTLRLAKVNEAGKTVLLENPRARGLNASLDANGKQMLVTAHSEIPEEMWVSAVGETTTPGNRGAVEDRKNTPEPPNRPAPPSRGRGRGGRRR